jgi:RNA polymerase-binding transcription factor
MGAVTSTIGKGSPMPPSTPRPDRRPELAGAVAQLHEERASLVTRISQLTSDMAALFEASRDSNADDEHDPEGQTIAYERSQLSAVTTRLRDHLREVDAALERVRAGTYGICVVCHRPIDVARMDARPTAVACVEHAESAARSTTT